MFEFIRSYFLEDLILDIIIGSIALGIAFVIPFRKMHARPEIDWDIIGLICMYLFSVLYLVIEEPVSEWLTNTSWIEAWQDTLLIMPWWFLFLVNFVVCDFAVYWAHRLLHTSWFWPTHAWHHAPKCLYWLSGLRASLPHTVFTLLPFTVIYLFIPVPSIWLANTFVMMIQIINQHYLHSNIYFPFQKQLEWVLVTPRMHFVHHSANKIYTDSNYGFIFSCWDRIFGTYTDPDTVDINDPLGLDYEISNIRLLLGIPVEKKTHKPIKLTANKRKTSFTP